MPAREFFVILYNHGCRAGDWCLDQRPGRAVGNGTPAVGGTRGDAHMNLICAYCGYNSLRVVRDYTGAPYATCPRCYRANPFYRTNSVNPPTEKKCSSITSDSGLIRHRDAWRIGRGNFWRIALSPLTDSNRSPRACMRQAGLSNRRLFRTTSSISRAGIHPRSHLWANEQGAAGRDPGLVRVSKL
jgi:hypothetical protein